MVPDAIERIHVERAIERITEEGVPEKREANKFALLYDGEEYPPKYTLGVAGEEAVGEMLETESYGGGRETNSHLRELGFTVVRKDRERVTVSRAVLGLDFGRDELKNTGDFEHAWLAAYHQLRARYRENPEPYRRRIRRIAETAIEEGADWLVLPACGLIHLKEEGLTPYLDVLEEFSWVSSGAMSIPGGEWAMVMREGEVVEWFDDSKPWALQMDSARVLTAISSTIGKYRDGTFDEVEEYPVGSEGRRIAVDMGHQQYTGRYVKTMRSVKRHLARDGEPDPLFILAYWHYSGAYRDYLWYEPRDAPFVFDTRTDILEGERVEDWVDHLRFTV
jgi:hypothetical protein